METAPSVNFTLLLFILLVVTGVFWFADRWYFAPQRRRAAKVAVAHMQERRTALEKQGLAIEGAVATDNDIEAARERVQSQPWWLEWTAGLFPVILVVFLLRSFVAEPFKIPSGSMEPTLVPGDLILVNKFEYGLRLPLIDTRLTPGELPRRGDVIVFRLPKDPKIDYIKRIVGLPGDTVSYENKQLVINGKPVQETSLPDYFDSGTMMYYKQYMEKLGAHDHRIMINQAAPPYLIGGPESFPNRDMCHYNAEGFVCTVPAGNYFAMGDNRDNSLDSRYWGFVPERNIIGKAFVVWMNFSAPKNIGLIH